MDGKITVVGDLHGQLEDLFSIFTINGLPCEKNHYLFNGDFVDRGTRGAEVLFALCALKVKIIAPLKYKRSTAPLRLTRSTASLRCEKQIIFAPLQN